MNANCKQLASATTDLTAFSDLRWGQRTFSKCEYKKKRSKKKKKHRNKPNKHFRPMPLMYGANRTAFAFFLLRKKVSRWHIFFFLFFSLVLFFLLLLSFVFGDFARFTFANETEVHILSALVGYKSAWKKGAKWPTRQVSRWFVLANVEQKKRKNDNKNNNSTKTRQGKFSLGIQF